MPLASSEGDDDVGLARRVAARETGAFEELVQRYTGRVYAVAFRMLSDAAEAEDLTQEVFVSLHKSIGSFRGDSKLSTWIYRVTKNRCLNRIKFLERRHVGRHIDIDDPNGRGVSDPETLSSATRDPDQKLHRQELSKLLEIHLMALPEEQRTLVVLRDLEELSYDEIVNITGLAMGTVKSRLHRARAALAKTLGPAIKEREQSQ